MWRVTAKGADTGTEYVYLVDAPDYAPESAVWDSACRQHGVEKRAGKSREFLSILPSAHRVEFYRPEGWKPATKEEILEKAAEKGLTLDASDLVPYGDAYRIDGMDAEEWLAVM